MTEVIRTEGWRWSRADVRAKVLRAILLAAGLLLVTWVAHRANTGRVLSVVRIAAPWLPVLVLLEIAVAATDLAALRTLLGADSRNVTNGAWLEGSAAAYFWSAMLPAGRAAGEAARAAVLSPALGATRAFAAAVRLQACSLLANAATSVLVMSVLVLGQRPDRRLLAALVGNAAVCAALGGSLLALGRNPRLGHWLRARFARGDRPSVSRPSSERQSARLVSAVLFCLLARLIQTVQCGVLLYAVGLVANGRSAVAAEGIRLVGSATGDLIPNQLGAAEGAYFVFSSTLGVADDAARSVSIPILTHVVQLVVATASLMAIATAPRQRKREKT